MHVFRRLTLATQTLLAVAALSAGCATFNPADTAVSLQVEGINMMGDQIGMAKWSGTGFWLDKRLLATNAHVATRGHRIVATDDNGNKYHFDTLVGLDPEGDIAILRADRDGDKPGVEFVDKPANPKDLRGHEILMIGNSGALGLGIFDGRITNVIGDPGAELILHNATVVGGSSGSAVFDKQSQQVVGIHHSSVPSLDSRFATPSWRIQKVLAEAKNRKGVALESLFTIPNLLQYAVLWGQREFCAPPGQAFDVPFMAKQASDLVVLMTPQNPESPYLVGLVAGGEVLWGGKLKGQAILPFALGTFGPMTIRVVNPPDAPGPICGAVGVGEVVWQKGIE
jgi:hypothetical protein